jgi:transposase
MLPPNVQADILQLHFSEGMSRRRIAKHLRINRKTVAAVIDRGQVLTKVHQTCPRKSILAPHYGLIKRLLDDEPDRSAINILQRLRKAGYQGGVTILRDYLRTVRPCVPNEAFIDLDFVPGEAGQVDWGEFGDVFGNGTKVHVFVMVLCWSRMLYLEFTLSETLPALLRCFQRALQFFGGRCLEYWLDNMPTVVAERVGHLIRLTPLFQAYRGFHGFKTVLCGIGKANEKGRVENGVKIVRYQFWPGRHFTGLDDMNNQARQWRDEFANRREHAATGKVPELVFPTEEAALLPLRHDPYETDDLLSTKVSPFFRVRFEKNDYTVPWTLGGRPVTVRADDNEVRIYYSNKLVTDHRRSYLKGQIIAKDEHVKALREHKAAASRTWQLETVSSYGPGCRRYLKIIQAGQRSLRAELRELLCLATVYGPQQLEESIDHLLKQGVVGVSNVERDLRLRSDAQANAPPPLELTQQHLRFVPPRPDLGEYDGLLLESRRDKGTENGAKGDKK